MSACQRTNSGEQLDECKWLAKIVVCAAIEALDAISDSIAGCNYQDRGSPITLPKLAKHSHPITFRQPAIEQYNVPRFRLQAMLSGIAICCVNYRIAFFSQPAHQKI